MAASSETALEGTPGKRSDPPLLKDWRVVVFSSCCALGGFLVALLIFGSPWHLPPAWGDIPTWLTAVGTILVAVVAIWIAFWTDKQAAARIAEERARGDAQLAAERTHSAELLATEQEFSRAQIAEERRLALEREQLAEARAVQVVHAEKLTSSDREPYNEPDEDIRALVAIVVNHGSAVITRVEAQFHLHSNSGGGSFVGTNRTEWLSGYGELHESLRAGLAGPPGFNLSFDRLAPWDRGIRFSTDPMATKFTRGWYPVVRWTDRWGLRWEHARGEVRQINESAPWNP